MDRIRAALASRRAAPSVSPALRSRVRRVLPTGDTLPDSSWARRHRWISALLWAHALAVPIFGIVTHHTVMHSLVEGSAVLIFAMLASTAALGRHGRSAMATMGLLSSSAILTHFSGGLIELHFHFFVMVVVASLYQSWVPFLLAIGFVVTHHGLMGAIDASSVYNHPSALANPWKWAAFHGVFILGESVACLVAWRLNEDALDGERAARVDLEKANADLAEAQALSGIGSWDWHLASGRVWWSDELYRILGEDPATFLPTVDAFLAHVHPDDRQRVSAIVDAATSGKTQLDYECRAVRLDGKTVVLHALARQVNDADGVLARFVGTCQDITERRRLEDEIQHRAFHDGLTGLANRALFLDRLTHALAVAQRHSLPLTVLYVDLDDFKSVNDSLGHMLGDELLVEVAGRLQVAVRDSDTVARLGGDEFAILLEGTDGAGAEEAAQRIRSSLRRTVHLNGSDVSVSTSIGIAAGEDVGGAADMLRNADIAMYAAKRNGKDGHQIFDDHMLSAVIDRMEMQAELSRAIANSELVLHYQPVVTLGGGELEAVEALVRWQHPQRGLLPPAEFVGVAEECGLIVDLGTWVMHKATADVRLLQQQLGRSLVVNVNVSPQQLTPPFVDVVSEALSASGLSASDLVVEITETTAMSHDERVLSVLQQLRELGVRVAIDDFGTGYSSLGYLGRLPVDILKIDRSFVSTVSGSVEEAALARAIVKLGRIFNLRTVAEGVETAAHVDALLGLGCESAQGFYFSRPVELDALLADDRWQASARDRSLVLAAAGITKS